MLTKTEAKVFEARKAQWREYYRMDWRERNEHSIQPFDQFMAGQPKVSGKVAEWIKRNARHSVEAEMSKL